MRNAKAVFIKQVQSLLKNPVMLIQAALFLVLVIVMSFFLRHDSAYDCESCIPAYVCTHCLEENASSNIPNPSLAGLFAVMFVGLALVGSSSALVFEDKTTKNLRFMTMAGVKPHQYLAGTATALFLFSCAVVLLYAVVGGYWGIETLQFVSVTAAGAIVSILLGNAIGLSKAPGLAFPISMVLGLGPTLSTFNDGLARWLRFTYTQQVRLAISDLGQDMSSSFLIIGINGVVILLFFAWMHRKGELRW